MGVCLLMKHLLALGIILGAWGAVYWVLAAMACDYLGADGYCIIELHPAVTGFILCGIGMVTAIYFYVHFKERGDFDGK